VPVAPPTTSFDVVPPVEVSGPTLPATGSSATPLAELGLGLALLGGAVVVATRRRADGREVHR
jgi:LPXTG-motif cell wall-anchored protein